MTHTNPRQPANVLGAVGLVVADRIAAAAAGAVPHGASAPAALIALESYLSGASIDTLRRVLGLTHSGAVRLVDRLAGAGLVERRSGDDARSVALGLTPAGRRTARQILRAREAALEELLGVLSARERAELNALLSAVLRGATGGREDAGRICRMCDGAACGHPAGECPVTRAADAATGRV